eukprot:CAMPEP_0197743730 /NCGR_PEP_ID=MMETSP1435-20131217/36107_1 /TAXON_ID=426625 /ORGANISM="Chaetoceros brevis, Strain CCMP164" /LENGTH=270 /DNA_ID=CAMNT_0043334787 /DNA_START=413 /DNA_END=1225 /DNA_ORIENTATION=-
MKTEKILDPYVAAMSLFGVSSARLLHHDLQLMKHVLTNTYKVKPISRDHWKDCIRWDETSYNKQTIDACLHIVNKMLDFGWYGVAIEFWKLNRVFNNYGYFDQTRAEKNDEEFYKYIFTVFDQYLNDEDLEKYFKALEENKVAKGASLVKVEDPACSCLGGVFVKRGKTRTILRDQGTCNIHDKKTRLTIVYNDEVSPASKKSNFSVKLDQIGNITSLNSKTKNVHADKLIEVSFTIEGHEETYLLRLLRGVDNIGEHVLTLIKNGSAST